MKYFISVLIVYFLLLTLSASFDQSAAPARQEVKVNTSANLSKN